MSLATPISPFRLSPIHDNIADGIAMSSQKSFTAAFRCGQWFTGRVASWSRQVVVRVGRLERTAAITASYLQHSSTVVRFELSFSLFTIALHWPLTINHITRQHSHRQTIYIWDEAAFRYIRCPSVVMSCSETWPLCHRQQFLTVALMLQLRLSICLSSETLCIMAKRCVYS